MELYDTHAHLDDPQLAEDVQGVIQRASAAGVSRILAVGTTLESSRNCAALAGSYGGLHSAAGIHPNHAGEAEPGDWDEIIKLAELPQVVALGETGLDLYWKDVPLPLQQDYFERHIRLSQATGMPLVIHMRESSAEILTMLSDLRAGGPIHGVMHSFTGDESLAREFLELGLHISFAGMLTYKKSDDLRVCARAIPSERLLVETDSPYLSPEPLRGKRPNEPARVVHTAQCLAEARGTTLAEIAQQTTANARRLFAK